MSKNTFRLAGAAFAVLFLGAIWGCSHEKSIVQDPRMLLDYALSPSDSTLAYLSEDYRNTIEKTKKRDSVKSGVYADYAVSLALAMRFDEADTFFDKETAAYPESQQYVTFLKESLTSAAGRENVRKRRIQDSIDREEALKNTLGNDFEFEKVRYPKGSKEYRQQQKEKKKARKAKEKEKKAARKAKAKEKQQMRDERDSQKKAAQKDRDEQKKLAQKERAQQKKAAKKERKQQKKDMQKAREQQKKQLQNEREQKKQQLQQEREQKQLQTATDTIENNTPADTTQTNSNTDK